MLAILPLMNEWWMKLRGNEIHHRASSIEDGLGMLATATNDLISYEKTPNKNQQISSELSPQHHHQQLQQQNYKNNQSFSSSQFYPSESFEWEYDGNLKKSIPSFSMSVKPEYIKRYSSTINSNEMRNRSIERENEYCDANNLSTIEFYSHTHRRQSCHMMIHNNDSYNSQQNSYNSKTGSINSTPKKSASVIEWPTQVITTSIHPQERLSETPTDGTTTTSESSPNFGDNVVYRKKSSTQPIQRQTTFSSEPRKSNGNGNFYEQLSGNGQSEQLENSPMSSGNSSATTTTMNSQGFPVIIPQNCSNKIAVAPLPQKKISYRKDDKESHRNFQRSSIGPNSSPYQITTNYLPTSKSANRLYRTSNEVVIDGHTPTPIGDEPTGLRVAQLESKVEELQRMTSKQNFMFTTSTPVTNDSLVKELISKDERIGQLQARIQFLSSEKEQQKIIYEKEREEWKKETENSRKMFLKHKEKIQKLQKDLEFCENHWKETEKQKNDEILQNQEKLHEKDKEIQILKEKILESTTKFSKQISEFEITMNLKNEKIIEMESLVAQMKIDKNSNMKKMMTPISGVETLSEMEDLTDVEDNFPTILPNRNENNTPNSRYSVTPSTTSEKYSTNLPSSFNQLFRTHFRRTQIVHDLTNKISEANLKILIGKNLDAEKILRYTTDTDAEDSESLVSEAPASSLRMTIPTAEKYLRKECDMLERTEKKLFDIRRQYLDVCKETNFANKYQNFNSTK